MLSNDGLFQNTGQVQGHVNVSTNILKMTIHWKTNNTAMLRHRAGLAPGKGGRGGRGKGDTLGMHYSFHLFFFIYMGERWGPFRTIIIVYKSGWNQSLKIFSFLLWCSVVEAISITLLETHKCNEVSRFIMRIDDQLHVCISCFTWVQGKCHTGTWA